MEKKYKELSTEEMIKEIHTYLKNQSWQDCEVDGCTKRISLMKGFKTCYECNKSKKEAEINSYM